MPNTTIIGAATVTGHPALYASVTVTTTGLSLTATDNFSMQWIARGTRSAQAATSTIGVTSGNVASCTLSFSTTEMVALFAGQTRDPLTGRLALWDTTTNVVYVLGDLDVYYAPEPTGVTVNSVSGTATLLLLTDTPSTYTGQALKVLRVNATGTAVEFTDALGVLSDTAPSALGSANAGASTEASRRDHVHPTTGLMLNTLADANSILYAVTDNTPAALALAANTFPARSSSGDIAAKTITDAALSVLDDATVGAMADTLGVLKLDQATPQTVTTGAPVFGGGVKVSLGQTYQLDTGVAIRAVPASYNWLFGDAGNATLTGTINTAVGYQALQLVTTGESNDAFGYRALQQCTTGGWNMGFGKYALRDATVASHCTGIGYAAGVHNVTGNANVSVGYQSNHDNYVGSYNTAVGYNSLCYLGPTAGTIFSIEDAGGGNVKVTSASHGRTDGDAITIDGTASYDGNYTVANALEHSFTIAHAYAGNDADGTWRLTAEYGDSNTAIGERSGLNLVTGRYNTFLGAHSGYHASQATAVDNTIVLGYEAYSTKSNQAVIGPSTITETLLRGNVGIGTTGPGAVLDINSATGACLRLTYNDSDGTPANYADLGVSSSGDLVLSPSGGAVGIGTSSPAARLDVAGASAIGTPVQTGSGLSDLTLGGTFAGSVAQTLRIKISTAAATDKFDWSTDGGTTWAATGVDITGAAQALSYTGVTVTFAATTGHTLNDYWSVALTPATGALNLADGIYQGGSRWLHKPGSANLALGYNCLTSAALTGRYNFAVGYDCMPGITTGIGQTAMGYRAGYALTTGQANVAVGYYALNSAATASNNVALGAYAGYSLTGSSSVAVGYAAGRYAADGSTPNAASSNSVYIGRDVRAYATGDTNEIVIGYAAIGAGSNTATLGNDSITTTQLKGNVRIGNADSNKALFGGGQDASVYYDGADLQIKANEVAASDIHLVTGATKAVKIDGAATLGAASTDVITCTGRMVLRTLASDPQDATPGNRPAGSVAEIAYYNAKLYLCVNAATPAWELVTSAA